MLIGVIIVVEQIVDDDEHDAEVFIKDNVATTCSFQDRIEVVLAASMKENKVLKKLKKDDKHDVKLTKD